MRLEVRNITKQYPDKLAVNNFSMELTQGVYGLLGPNGSGKTTLMRIIADVLRPTMGEVLLDGQNIMDMGERYRDLLGYLPQNIGLYKNFTVERFLMYIAALKGLNGKKALAKVEEMLETVNLTEHAKRKTGNLSGGMRQRLGIAQALLNDPRVLILDEPTTGLDPKERIKFRNLISDISRDRIVILSTHIVSDVEYVAKKVILIKNGELLRCATGDELLSDMQGKVWVAELEEGEFRRLQGQFAVGNILRKSDSVEMRIISETKPLDCAKPQAPAFEDVYLYYFNTESDEE